MKKFALFAFNGEPMCFVHALLNALDMKEKGHDIRLIIEGTATAQIRELTDRGTPFSPLYEKVKNADIIDCVCRACANQTGSLESAETQGLTLCAEMSGHPSMAKYIDLGYEIIVF
jgi:hypothetical protein